VNSVSVKSPEANAAYFNVKLSLWACLAILADLSYPICGFNAVTNINELLSSSSILLVLAWIPLTQFLVNEMDESEISLMLCKTFLIINGLKTFNSKCPLEPPAVTATLFPKT